MLGYTATFVIIVILSINTLLLMLQLVDVTACGGATPIVAPTRITTNTTNTMTLLVIIRI